MVVNVHVLDEVVVLAIDALSTTGMGSVAAPLAVLDLDVGVDIVGLVGLAVVPLLDVTRDSVAGDAVDPVSISNVRARALIIAMLGDEVVVGVVDTVK